MTVKVLSKDDIIQANDLPREFVEVPEWGGGVWVYGLSGTMRDAYELMVIGKADSDRTVNLRNFRARFCALVMRGEDGNQLFSDKEAHELGKKYGKVLDRIKDIGERLSGIGAEEVEELEGNSDADPSDDSTSD